MHSKTGSSNDLGLKSLEHDETLKSEIAVSIIVSYMKPSNFYYEVRQTHYKNQN